MRVDERRRRLTTVAWRELLDADRRGDRRSRTRRAGCARSRRPLDGDEFLERLDEPATERMVAHLDAMVARYRSGEPLQYVLGRWSFRHLDLAIDRRVLIPRPETELVAEVAIELAARCRPGRTVADLGTGSGAIGLSIAVRTPTRRAPRCGSPMRTATHSTWRGRTLLGSGRAAANVRVAHGSWFEALPDSTQFDVIVSNPPYVADGSPDLDDGVGDWEPASALFAGADGLDDIRTLVTGAPRWLRPGGSLVLEIGADQGRAVEEVFVRSGLVEIEVRPDLSGRDRIAIARRPT